MGTGESGRRFFLPDEPAELEVGPSSIVAIGLQELLADPHTPLPIALGIAGRFGTGKSSVLRLLEDRLVAGRIQERPRAWAVVNVDLSYAQTREEVWAVLVSSLYQQLDSARKIPHRFAYRWRLERLRRGRKAFYAKVVLPMLLGVLIAACGAIAAMTELTGWIPSVAVPLGVAAAVLGLSRSSARNLKDPIRWLADLKAPDQVARNVPVFDSADQEVSNIVRANVPSGRLIALFIEGLDQPEPIQLTERIAAIRMIRQSRRRHQIAIVIALDKEMVLASLEVSFGNFFQQLRDRQHPAGEEGVEGQVADAIDLSVALPNPDSQLMQRYLNSLTGSRLGEAVLGGVLDAGLTRMLEHASMTIAPMLPPNPRAMKQFLLAFRLQFRLAANVVPLDLDHMFLLGKWVVLRRTWPRLATEIDRDPALLEALESEVGLRAPSSGATGLARRARQWLADRPELGSLLRTTWGDIALGDLPLRDFLHIA